MSESGIQKRNCSLLCIILRIRHRLRIWRNDKLINQLTSTALWICIPYYAAPCPNPGSENKIAHYYADPCPKPESKNNIAHYHAYLGPDPGSNDQLVPTDPALTPGSGEMTN